MHATAVTLMSRAVLTTAIALVFAVPVVTMPQSTPRGGVPAERPLTMTCGSRQISVLVSGPTGRLTIGERTIEMRQVVSASGAKYEAVADPSTTFWSKGDTATLVLDGTTLPQCASPSAAGTADVLRARTWVVESLAGKPLVGGARVTIEFGDEGRMAGASGCNTYTAAYALSEDGLTIRHPASTRMACTNALMQQERAFLKVLGRIRRFESRPDGVLVLEAPDATITARLEPPRSR